MPYMMPKSKRGARRQYDALMRKYRRDYAGGGSFGFDWPTLRANAPQLYAHLHAMNAAFRYLPD
jgi:hypothetical protein